MNFSFGWIFYLVILMAMQLADPVNCSQPGQPLPPQISITHPPTSLPTQPGRRLTLNMQQLTAGGPLTPRSAAKSSAATTSTVMWNLISDLRIEAEKAVLAAISTWEFPHYSPATPIQPEDVIA